MKPSYKYILDDNGNPVVENDTLAWARWMETAREKRIVASTEVGDLRVSTVFLGLDYRFDDGDPLLYESMVFEIKLSKSKPLKVGKREIRGFDYHKSIDKDGYYERYTTKEQALEGHDRIVKLVTEQEK